MEEIWEAAMEGDLGEVQRLVGQDPGLLDAKDDYDLTPLIYASREGHVEAARWLLDEGACALEKDCRGWNGLFMASCYGHVTPPL
jgi:ankyrin repeat protein